MSRCKFVTFCTSSSSFFFDHKGMLTRFRQQSVVSQYMQYANCIWTHLDSIQLVLFTHCCNWVSTRRQELPKHNKGKLTLFIVTNNSNPESHTLITIQKYIICDRNNRFRITIHFQTSTKIIESNRINMSLKSDSCLFLICLVV